MENRTDQSDITATWIALDSDENYTTMRGHLSSFIICSVHGVKFLQKVNFITLEWYISKCGVMNQNEDEIYYVEINAESISNWKGYMIRPGLGYDPHLNIYPFWTLTPFPCIRSFSKAIAGGGLVHHQPIMSRIFFQINKLEESARTHFFGASYEHWRHLYQSPENALENNDEICCSVQPVTRWTVIIPITYPTSMFGS